MTWSTARTQLASIVEAASPSSRTKGLGSFRHAPDAGPDKLPDSRGFWLALEAGAARGPLTPGLATRRRERVVLTVSYRHQSARKQLDDVIGEDMDVIAKALLDEHGWGRPTSTIITLSLGEVELMPFVVEPVDGGVLVRVRFPLEHAT